MIHVRDIRRAIKGLPDEAIAVAEFSHGSDSVAVGSFDLNLEDVFRVQSGTNGDFLAVSVHLAEVQDDEKKDSDYPSCQDCDCTPLTGCQGFVGHYANEQDQYNANALISGAAPSLLDPRD